MALAWACCSGVSQEGMNFGADLYRKGKVGLMMGVSSGVVAQMAAAMLAPVGVFVGTTVVDTVGGDELAVLD